MLVGTSMSTSTISSAFLYLILCIRPDDAHLPLLMILPPLGSWLFISRVAYLVQRTEAVTLMFMRERNFSMGRSSMGISGREIPAFCTRCRRSRWKER